MKCHFFAVCFVLILATHTVAHSNLNCGSQLRAEESRIKRASCLITQDCDNPSVVLQYTSDFLQQKLSPRVIDTVVYIIAQNGGVNPLISEREAQMQIQIINKAFYPYNISFSANIEIFPSTFLFDRKVLPFCAPPMVGDGVCQIFCNVTDTGFDGGDCVNILEKFPCNQSQRGDGTCNEECNFYQYNWDNGDCCLPGGSVSTCRDPKSPLKVWIDQSTVKSVVQVNGTQSFNIYIARYEDIAQCPFCLADSTMPWTLSPHDVTQQGSLFNYLVFGGLESMFKGQVAIHELGHTFGLWHVFNGAETGMGCQNPCYEGKQYPLSQNGSMLIGDLCADTRPSPMNPMCMDPPGQDCSGQAWFNTPIHNYMGFTFAMDPSCVNQFSPQQVGRMRCYIDRYLRDWLV